MLTRFIFAGLLLSGAALAAAPAQAPAAPPVGVYRSAPDYRHRHPAPAGDDVRYAAKHDQFVVTTRRGSSKFKHSVARDSVWGFVDDKLRTYRLQGPDDFRVEQADTITVYSRNATTASTAQSGYRGAVNGSVYSTTHYFFSRGLTGRIYPLTNKYLREAFAAGSPAFLAAVNNRPAGRDLAAYDKATNAFYIATLFRSTQGK